MVSMKYGSIHNKTQGDSTEEQESAIIASGLIDDGNPVVLDMFEAGGLYELTTAEYAKSNSAFRGMRQILIYAPEEAYFGTVALSHVNEAVSSATGVTFAWNADTTLTISQNSYAVRYILRDLSI